MHRGIYIEWRIGLILTQKMKQKAGKPNGEEPEDKKEFTAEEKELLKKLEKGELELMDGKKSGPRGPVNKDPKYSVFTEMGYEVDQKMGIIYKDMDVIVKQRKAIFHMLKTLGSNILHGKALMNVSMPVNIFDKCTLLQRSAGDYMYAPIYLEKMYATDDPIEKMKYAVAFYIAGLHLSICQKKPFNPILGETYQGKIGDDLDVYCEQISHHPPITYTYLDSPHYTIDGSQEFSLKAYPNSAIFRCIGFRRIVLKDKAKTTYIIKFPWTEGKGFMFGARYFTFKGDVTIKDKTNKIYTQLRLDAGEKSFAEGLFKKQETRNDFFKGMITKNKALIKDMSRKAFYSKEMISYIEGHWIDYVMIDGEKYWEIGAVKTPLLTPVTNPLPSDSCYREDLKSFIADNEAESQKNKEIMEEIQRNDRKLREQYSKTTK